MDLDDVYDMLLNACVQGDAQNALQTLEASLTSKQIKMLKNRALAAGMVIPTEKVQLPTVVISAKKEHSIDDKAIFQSVADQFLLFIYGKKFNSGLNGAFGVAQQILPSARGHNIILLHRSTPSELKFPADCDPSSSSRVVGFEVYWKKLTSSINHYNKDGNGTAKIEYV
jgi:hypothetical protein